MEETEIDQTQNFYISKMSNFAHYVTSLRKFLTETTNLWFPRKLFDFDMTVIAIEWLYKNGD